MGSARFSRRGFFHALPGVCSVFLCFRAGPQGGAVKEGYRPAYLRLHRNGELKKRGERLWNRMSSCGLCPRECGANRLEGEAGFCGASADLIVSSYHPHFGEEKPLVGRHGSGTIFLSHCGLRCVFCINHEISHGGAGRKTGLESLASMMLRLQEIGCHNINVVTPTHYSPYILLSLDIAAEQGLRLPLVYNTCGWEKTEILKELDGVVDVYLPDFKYWDGDTAGLYSAGAVTYPEVMRAALEEMYRQVGVARPDDGGLMRRGLMIRHLVMPNGVEETKKIVEWIAQHLSRDTYVNLMSQYRPVHRAFDHPGISRTLTRREYADAVRFARTAGLNNLEIQGMPL